MSGDARADESVVYYYCSTLGPSTPASHGTRHTSNSHCHWRSEPQWVARTPADRSLRLRARVSDLESIRTHKSLSKIDGVVVIVVVLRYRHTGIRATMTLARTGTVTAARRGSLSAVQLTVPLAVPKP